MLLVDFVALSLAPLGQWRTVAERLRARAAPQDVLAELSMARGRRSAALDARDLRARASAALERAERLAPDVISGYLVDPRVTAVQVQVRVTDDVDGLAAAGLGELVDDLRRVAWARWAEQRRNRIGSWLRLAD